MFLSDGFCEPISTETIGSSGMSEAQGLPPAHERLLCGEAQNRMAKR
jgi:hypothetical protein